MEQKVRSNRIKGVIFDLDGTLIDSLETYTRAFNQGIEAFGLKAISKEKLAAFLSTAKGLEEILLEAFPDVFEDEELRRTCMEKIRKAYLELEKEGIPLLGDVKEVLFLLKKKGLKVGIVTARTTTGEMKWFELRRLGIADYIDSMVTGAEAARKPAPDSIIKCLAELGLSPEEVVFVGDARTDVIAAKRANVTAIAVSTGVANRESLLAEGPFTVVDSLSQLMNLIEEMNRKSAVE